MSKTKAKVQKLLKQTFEADQIRETEDGFKINTENLCGMDIQTLSKIVSVEWIVNVKRSGTGVVVIIRQ